MPSLGTGSIQKPFFSLEFAQDILTDRPVGRAIRLIHDENEWNVSERVLGAVLEIDGIVQSLRTGTVCHQNVARSAAKVGDPERNEFILARQIPDDQIEHLVRDGDCSLVNAHPHGGLVSLGEDAPHEPLRETGFADRKGAQQADFLLHH